VWRRVLAREVLWQNAGHVDDVVKFASLTKLSAVHLKQTIGRHPAVEASVAAGDAKTKPFVVVPPAQGLPRTESQYGRPS